jgi:hypothetical protein
MPGFQNLACFIQADGLKHQVERSKNHELDTANCSLLLVPLLYFLDGIAAKLC